MFGDILQSHLSAVKIWLCFITLTCILPTENVHNTLFIIWLHAQAGSLTTVIDNVYEKLDKHSIALANQVRSFRQSPKPGSLLYSYIHRFPNYIRLGSSLTPVSAFAPCISSVVFWRGNRGKII